MHDHILADLGFFKQPITADVENNSPIDLTGPIEMEHLSYLRNGLAVYSADNWNLTDVDLMTKEVQYFKNRGGHTILEPSAPGIRCHTDKLKYISETTGVNIVASTGLYREETWPASFTTMGPRDIQAFLLEEINCGIDGSRVKAGHLKTAIADGSDREFNFLRSVVPATTIRLNGGPTTLSLGLKMTRSTLSFGMGGLVRLA